MLAPGVAVAAAPAAVTRDPSDPGLGSRSEGAPIRNDGSRQRDAQALPTGVAAAAAAVAAAVGDAPEADAVEGTGADGVDAREVPEDPTSQTGNALVDRATGGKAEGAAMGLWVIGGSGGSGGKAGTGGGHSGGGGGGGPQPTALSCRVVRSVPPDPGTSEAMEELAVGACGWRGDELVGTAQRAGCGVDGKLWWVVGSKLEAALAAAAAVT